MPEQASNISVTAPLTPAFERMKKLLFQPFDPAVWLTIGFGAWLAQLGRLEGGGGGGTGFRGGGGGNVSLEEAIQEAWNYIQANLYWLVPLIAGIALVALVIWVLFTWLGSRGDFMLLHCVAEKKAEVVVPWNLYARHANSLFVFRLILGLVAFALIAPVTVLGFFVFHRMLVGESPGFWLGLVVAVTVLTVVAISLVFALIHKMTRDFVVPIMFLHTENCVVAWRRFLLLLTRHIPEFVLYILFSLVIAVVIGLLMLAVVIITCCCAGCLFSLPYVGTVLLLPIYVFTRAYSAEYLAQYGTDYMVFRWPPQGSAGVINV